MIYAYLPAHWWLVVLLLAILYILDSLLYVPYVKAYQSGAVHYYLYEGKFAVLADRDYPSSKISRIGRQHNTSMKLGILGFLLFLGIAIPFFNGTSYFEFAAGFYLFPALHLCQVELLSIYEYKILAAPGHGLTGKLTFSDSAVHRRRATQRLTWLAPMLLASALAPNLMLLGGLCGMLYSVLISAKAANKCRGRENEDKSMNEVKPA